MTLSSWFWHLVALFLLIVVIDAIRAWREGDPTDYYRDWSDR